VIAPAARTRGFGETVFAVYARRAAEHGALDLGQGFPSDGPPAFVREALRDAADGPQQYAPLPGLPDLLREVAHDHGRWLGRALDPHANVQITVGATEALFAAMQAFVEPGDEVVLFEPFYDAYPADVTMTGGVVRAVPLRPDAHGRWTFDPAELRTAVGPATKAIVINTPHNPTGTVFTGAELDAVVREAERVDALLISDEVYEHLAFDGPVRLATRPGAWERTLSVSSFGKSFSATGWKVGWAIGPEPLVDALRMAHQWIPFAVATPLQAAAAASLRAARAGDDAYWRELRATYRVRADALVAALAATPLRAARPEGGYFVMADASALGYEDDAAACRDLPARVGVGAIPPSAFYTEAHRHEARAWIRLAFCKPEGDLAEAGRRLARLTAAPAATPFTPDEEAPRP
jgi:N-succinyldiaminopimelate aminotransferase